MIGHLGACRLCLDCDTVFADAHAVDRAPARCPHCLSRSHVSVKDLIERERKEIPWRSSAISK